MEKLSALENSLLMSIQLRPDRHEVFHAGAISATIFETNRAVKVLKNLGLIRENDHSRFIVNPKAMERVNAETLHENQSTGVVHRADSKPIEAQPMTETVAKVSTLSLPRNPTDESVYSQLVEAGTRGTTAQDMARPYGCKGTSLVQILRRLRDEGKATKFGTQWTVATPADAVTHIEVPHDPRRAVNGVTELERIIALQEGWFTAQECHALVQKAYIVEWTFFYGVFMDMAINGFFSVKENGVLVSYELSNDGDNKHANTRRGLQGEDLNKIIQDYIYVAQQGGSQRWNLNHIVEVTRIQSDMLLHWFELAGFDVSDISSIGPVEPSKEYLPVDRLSAKAVEEFIGAGGCTVKAFVKFFNLDPAITDKIGNVLDQVGLAKYNVENKYLMLPKSAMATAEEFKPPRVTMDEETGVETVRMLSHEAPPGTVLQEVRVDGSGRNVQRFYMANPFYGQPILPTDDPDVYLVQIPECMASLYVSPHGLYEPQDDEPVLVEASEDRQAAYTKDALAKERQGSTIGENTEGVKGTEGHRCYASFPYGEKGVSGPDPHPEGPTSEGKNLNILTEQIDTLLNNIRESSVKAGPRYESPLLGMHLYEVVPSVSELPTHVRDENSIYNGCEIYPTDDVRYCTIVIPYGHAAWGQHFSSGIVQADGSIRSANDWENLKNPEGGFKQRPEHEVEIIDENPVDVEYPDDAVEEQPDPAEKAPFDLDALVAEMANVGSPNEILSELYAGIDRYKSAIGAMRAKYGIDPLPMCTTTTPTGGQTVKPEWTSGLALIADQHKRSSATYKLLHEIKEYLEK